MKRTSIQLCADRFSDRKAGLPDQPAAQILSGTIAGDSCMKHIPLTQGKFAIVDDEDFKEISQYRWFAHKDGRTFYAYRKIKTNSKHCRQLLFQMAHGILVNIPNSKLIDHKNGNGLDNRRENLRICNYSQNGANQKPQKNCSSKYKGVWWNKWDKRFQAAIKKNGKRTYLGYFDDEVEAAKAYDKKAKELFGEFARLNNV